MTATLGSWTHFSWLYKQKEPNAFDMHFVGIKALRSKQGDFVVRLFLFILFSFVLEGLKVLMYCAINTIDACLGLQRQRHVISKSNGILRRLNPIFFLFFFKKTEIICTVKITVVAQLGVIF